MCEHCLARRSFLAFTGSALAAAVLRPAQVNAADDMTTVTADQALTRLKQGNARFVESPKLCALDLANARESVAEAQAPWATILSCSDSRVPPELLFGGIGVGELFVARNAGNMADMATMGTVEYGAGPLGAPLIVVLGHDGCGAAKAACEVVEKNATFPGSIGPMVDAIVPVARAMRGKPGDFVDNVVRESAKQTAEKIRKSPVVSSLVSSGKVKVVAARYDLGSGMVEYIA